MLSMKRLSKLRTLQDSLGAAFPECLSSKESVMINIEEMHRFSVVCTERRKKGVFGLVVLLGSVATTSLSRVLSEYLGQHTMLALVCKSSKFVSKSAEYLRFQSKAEKLGRSITDRFHVLCLDATRPWKGEFVENDPQRKLAMDDPKLPNGGPVPGFKGYAVNMIDLGPEELEIKTHAGHGLRETLYYSLFGNLQVYETQTHVEEALPYINGGFAVSLDGFIAKENEFICSRCSIPEIHFPITVKDDEEEKLRKFEVTRDRVRMTATKITEERSSLLKLEKRLKKTNERYDKATSLDFDS